MLTVVPVCSKRTDFFMMRIQSVHRIEFVWINETLYFYVCHIIHFESKPSILCEYLFFFLYIYHDDVVIFYVRRVKYAHAKRFPIVFFLLLFTRCKRPIPDGSLHEMGESLCRPNRAYITRRSG